MHIDSRCAFCQQPEITDIPVSANVLLQQKAYLESLSNDIIINGAEPIAPFLSVCVQERIFLVI